MFRKCFLHVGNPHAGSTSIQGALADQAALLLEHGFCYPTVERNHGALAADKAPRSRRAKAITSRKRRNAEAQADLGEICEAFRAAFEREIAGTSAHTLLISSEFFVTLPVDELQALGAYLGQFAEEVIVVCYVRHPYSDFMSRLQHRTKRGNARLRDFPRDHVPSVLPERLDRLVEAFGRDHLVLRQFERGHLYKKDAVADFLQAAGAPDALIEQVDAPELNVSPSHEAMVIADALLGLGVGVGGIGKAEPSQTRLLRLLYSRVKGSRLGFDDESAAALLADSRSQVERMRRDHGLELTEPRLTPASARWSDETLTDLAEVIVELAGRGRGRRRGKVEGKEPGQERLGKRRRRKLQPQEQ